MEFKNALFNEIQNHSIIYDSNIKIQYNSQFYYSIGLKNTIFNEILQ